MTDDSLREKVARIVDPVGWATFDRQTKGLRRLADNSENLPADALGGPSFYTRGSLAKADAILSLVQEGGLERTAPIEPCSCDAAPEVINRGTGQNWSVWCASCGRSGPSHWDRGRAVSLWNEARRAR